MVRRRGDQRGLTTLLFTDIVNSTEVAVELGDRRWRSLQARHHAEVRRQLKRHGGHEVDTAGDGFFATFESPASGARCAFEIVKRVREIGLEVRAGLHFGEAELTGEKVGGIAVTTAQRVESAAGAGQVFATDTIVHLVAGSGLEFTEVGSRELKGVPGRWEVFSLVAIDGQPIGSSLDSQQAAEYRAASVSKGQRRVARRMLTWPRGVAVTVAVVLVVVALPLILTRGGGGLPGIAANAIGMIDPSNGHITDQIPVGQNPQRVAVDPSGIWATNEVDNTVSRIDPNTRAERDRIPVGTAPGGIAVGYGAVWVTNSFDGTVTRIDPANNQPAAPIHVGNGPDGIVAAFDSVWVADVLDAAIVRIDPSNGHVQKTISLDAGPTAIAASDDAIWVTLFQANSVVKIDPNSDSTTEISVGNGPDAISSGPAGVWVANSLDGSISHIGVPTNSVASTIPVGTGPASLFVGQDTVWVADEYGQTVDRVDPSANVVTERIEIGNRPEGIALAPTGLLVAVREGGEGHRGGTIRADEPFTPPLDPATWFIWVQPYTSDGLVAFKRADGIESELLVPDLAVALPQPTDGGKTYTFTLRKGVSYSDGQLLKPSDVRYSIERLFKLSTNFPSFVGGYLTSIVGAKACARRPQTCSFAKGIRSDDASNTVTFHLARPDAALLYQLTLVYLVPSGTPMQDLEGPQFAPGTGPYMVASYTSQAKKTQPSQLRLVRNLHFSVWSPAARPDGYPDEIDATFQDPADQNDVAVDMDAVRAVEHGQADFAPVGGDFPFDPRIFEEVATSYSSLVHTYPLAGTVSLVLDPTKPPFDSLAARQALSYALDRMKIVGLSGGIVTCQFLPAGFPGYKPYCPYTSSGAPSTGYPYEGPDLARAQALVRRSHTAGDRVVVDWTTNGFPLPRIGRYVVNVLSDLGYKARLKWVSQTGLTDNITSAVGFGFDYPLASETTSSIVGCPGLLGVSCDQSLTRAMNEATRQETINLADANRDWDRVDRMIVNHSYIVPLYQLVERLIVSSRVHNFQNGNGAVLKDQFWVS